MSSGCEARWSIVSSGVLHGILNISPEEDPSRRHGHDQFTHPIFFVSGTPASYDQYFRIDKDTGAVHQIKPVDTSTTKKFSLIIKILKEAFSLQ
ncbi:hypothetical protein NQ317_000024 [Molorchus minor]|uniref:Uncharacterized protein n=1 Tax=Molorchus minor TaxID=1323400 RepID=A0ABQ9JVQ9_9CUCU|nr:hypothetical protein NQ317_000024 [Molorchus minor]